MYTWTFEDLNVYNDIADAEPKQVSVEFALTCEITTWEIESIEIVFDTVKTLKITEEQLSQLFPNGDDMINNAIEAAAKNGVCHG